MSEWKYRGVLRRDFRHIHHEDREFFPKASKNKRKRYRRHAHRYSDWTNGTYWKSRRCLVCSRKETEYVWSRFNEYLSGERTRRLAPTFDLFRRTHRRQVQG